MSVDGGTGTLSCTTCSAGGTQSTVLKTPWLLTPLSIGARPIVSLRRYSDTIPLCQANDVALLPGLVCLAAPWG